MGQITVLDDNMINMIAAGEVIKNATIFSAGLLKYL